jgi:HD-like signal output (HDOD) protein
MVLINSNGNGDNQIELEQERYKTDHAIIGYYIATSWNLPKELCKIILVHHETDFLDSLTGEQEQISYAVLKAAEDMVSRAKMFKPSNEWPFIEGNIYNVLGIDEVEYFDLVDIFEESINV